MLRRQAIIKLPETADKAKAVDRQQSHTQTERKPTPSVKTISTDCNGYDVPHYNYKLEFKRGRQEMRRRFGEDGLVELGIIQALQRHSLRTMDATKADIFVVPLVMASMIMFDKSNTTRESLDYLRHHHHF